MKALKDDDFGDHSFILVQEHRLSQGSKLDQAHRTLARLGWTGFLCPTPPLLAEALGVFGGRVWGLATWVNTESQMRHQLMWWAVEALGVCDLFLTMGKPEQSRTACIG